MIFFLFHEFDWLLQVRLNYLFNVITCYKEYLTMIDQIWFLMECRVLCYNGNDSAHRDLFWSFFTLEKEDNTLQK